MESPWLNVWNFHIPTLKKTVKMAQFWCAFRIWNFQLGLDFLGILGDAMTPRLGSVQPKVA